MRRFCCFFLHNMYNHVLFSLLACDKKIVEHDIKNGRLFLGCDVQSWKAGIHLRHRIQVQIEANQPNTILTFTSSRIVFGSYKLLRKKKSNNYNSIWFIHKMKTDSNSWTLEIRWPVEQWSIRASYDSVPIESWQMIGVLHDCHL